MDIVLAVFLAAALTRIPETRPTTTAAAQSTASMHVPADIRGPFIAAAIAGAASFMMVGWVFGLSPSYLHAELGIDLTRPIVTGSFAALVMITNGATQLLLRRQQSPATLHFALGGVALGMATMAASTVMDSLAVAITGALIAGAASGLTQMNAMATIQRVVPIHARGTVMSTYLTICYTALSLPVIIAGTIADHLGLGVVSAGYVVGPTAVVCVAIGLSAHLAQPPADVPIPVESAAGRTATDLEPLINR